MVTIIGVSLLIHTTHFFHTPLLFGMTLLVEATLLFKPMRIGRATVRIPQWRRRTSVPHILHTGSVLLIRRLLDGWLIFPFTQSFGCYRGGTVMFTVEVGN